MKTLSRRHVVYGLGASGAAGVLSGCAGPSLPPVQRFYLRSHDTPPERLAPADWSLQIDPPQTVPALNTNRIAQLISANQFDYYADAEWGDIATVMMQTVLVSSFERTGSVASVFNERARTRPDFVLQTALGPFFGEGAVGSAATARVGLRADLLRYRGREVLGTTSFASEAVADAPGVAALVAALDVAARAVVGDVIAWTIATGNSVDLGA